MSDPIGGTGSSGEGPKATAEIEFVVKNINQALTIVRNASKTMEKDIQGLDKIIQAVNKSLGIMSQEAKTAFQLAKAEATKATAELTRAKNALAQTKDQPARRDHQETMKNLQMQGNAATRLHQQQMGALRSSGQLQRQNHQLVMATYNQQNLALKATMQTQRQNHQIAMAQIRQQGQAARQAQVGAGGGFGGGLAGFGRVAGGLMGQGGGLGAVVGGLAGGFAGGLLVQGIISTTNAMIAGIAAADELTRSYERQGLAGRTLAGSQEELNNLLEVYDKATGEALSKAKQMENVVRLQAVGFADSEQEIERFSKAIRGISLAIGAPADYVTQNLILELFSQRGQRLDQLGLQYDDVRRRQEELMQSDRTLTKQTAYQQAVLDQALDRYGALSSSVEGQATGVERLAAAWDDLGLSFAQLITGPLDTLLVKMAQLVDYIAQLTGTLAEVNPNDIQYPVPPGGYSISQRGFGGMLPDTISYGQSRGVLNNALARKAEIESLTGLNAFIRAIQNATGIAESMEDIDLTIRQAQRNLAVISVARMRETNWQDRTPSGRTGTYDDRPLPKPLTEEQEDEVRQFNIARADIERDTNRAILEENQEYAQRREDIERDYQQKVSEEAEDFYRKRARDEAEFQKDINNFMMDSAKKQLEIREDLNKTIEKANRDHARDMEKMERDHGRDLEKMREDAADQEAEVIEDLEEKQQEAREDSAEKITEMEEEFGRNREKAARAHNESILQAASRLDAAAVFWEQKKYARERKEAEEEHARKIAKEKETLDEELSENDEASAERLEQIKENLADEIAEANEAHAIRVKDAQEAHAQQLADQQTAAAERLAEVVKEDEERLAEMKQGHIDRLAEEDADRGIRLARDKTHHDNQLSELDRVHGLRITQIGTQAQEERDKLDAEHRQKMLDLGFQNTQWMEADRRARNIALKQHELFLKEDTMLDLQARKAAFELRRNDPSTSAEEAASLATSIGYLNDQIIAIGQAIYNTQTELNNLPLPQTNLLPSSPRSSDISEEEEGKISAAGGVDLGVWTGTGQAPMIAGTGNTVSSGAISITVEQGAIVLNAAPGENVASLGDQFEQRLLQTLRKVAKVG